MLPSVLVERNMFTALTERDLDDIEASDARYTRYGGNDNVTIKKYDLTIKTTD